MDAVNPPESTSRVAVVTVSYGSRGVLERFLESVPGSTFNPIELVVVDNRPDEQHGVADTAGRHDARYLPLPANPGYGGAINAAVRDLGTNIDWVLVSNPDLVLGEGSVDAMVETGDGDSRIGSVGPATFTESGELYPSARAVPSLRTGVGHALFANIWIGNPWTRAYRNDSEAIPRRRDAGWLSGACVLIRRSAFDEIGGFDDGFFMYFEDVDLGFRLGRHGYRNVYEPAAAVTHTGAHSTAGESARMIAAHHTSARRFIRKKYAGALLWPIRAVLDVGLRVRSAVLMRRSAHG